MSPAALTDNVKRAASLARNPSDFLKFLYWVYGLRWPLSAGLLTLSIRLPQPIGDVRLTVRSGSGADYFIFSEVFEHKYYDIPLTEIPPTILDVGGNIGLTAIFLARCFPGARIACVEPMADNVRLLRTNLEQNHIDARIFASAASVSDEPVVMVRSDKEYGSKVANIAYGAAIAGREVAVSASTIPSIIKDLGWARIGLLKMDIEGYEGVLLRKDAGWLSVVDNLCVEIHEGFSEEDLAAVAVANGFEQPQRLPGIWLLSRPRDVV